MRVTTLLIVCLLGQLGLAMAESVTLNGVVTGVGEPWRGARVTLYAGNEDVETLGVTSTSSSGRFSIEFCDVPANAVLYVEAVPGSGSDVRLMAIVGNYGHLTGQTTGQQVYLAVNELTTLATVFSMQQFMDDDNQLHGNAPGLQNAVATAYNLANPVTGLGGNVLATAPNNLQAASRFYSLANALATCTDDDGDNDCDDLRDVSGGSRASDSTQALLRIVKNPFDDVQEIYDLSLTGPTPFVSLLTSAPTASGWTMILLFTDRGFNAPGRPAFDVDGNIWWANNFNAPVSPDFVTRNFEASLGVPILGPDGQSTLGAPIRGGGISGPGYGVMFSTDGTAWIGNYAGNTISHLTADGELISPSSGYTDGDICHPQGMMSDSDGNIWIVNNGGATNDNASVCPTPFNVNVVVYPDGDHTRAVEYTDNVVTPFDVAIDGQDRAWITNAGETLGSVIVLQYDDDDGVIREALPPITNGGIGSSTTAPVSGIKADLIAFLDQLGFSSPKTIAVDSNGFVWVVNFEGNTLTLIEPDGDVDPRSPISVTGAAGGWGLCIDASDRVWVADFASQSVALVCGANAEDCLSGQEAGDRIFQIESELFQHFTGIQIDESGNLWAANNIDSNHIQPDGTSTLAGGDGVVQIVGLAPPVRAPLIGPPQSPRTTSFNGDLVFECVSSVSVESSSFSSSDGSALAASALVVLFTFVVTFM